VGQFEVSSSSVSDFMNVKLIGVIHTLRKPNRHNKEGLGACRTKHCCSNSNEAGLLSRLSGASPEFQQVVRAAGEAPFASVRLQSPPHAPPAILHRLDLSEYWLYCLAPFLVHRPACFRQQFALHPVFYGSMLGHPATRRKGLRQGFALLPIFRRGAKSALP